MELSEKLQMLRKNKGLTQEELAQALFVTRTAVSKWESGRGYPSIDSLREISRFYGVSIDELLSGEQLITIAETENRSNIRTLCDILMGAADLFSFMLIVLPLYPNPVNGFVYSVNLPDYAGKSAVYLAAYWGMYLTLTVIGTVKLLLAGMRIEKGRNAVTYGSVCFGIVCVLFLIMAKEVYAASVLLLQLVIKGVLLVRQIKAR